MKSNTVIRCESGVCSRLGSSEVSYRLPRGRGLPSLYKDIRNKEAEIRFYYIDSVEWVDGEGRKPGLYQFGCGLNLMGRYATLCTCKLKMLKVIHDAIERSGKRPIYVAVLGDTKGRRRSNSKITPLVFLGKVERSFNSFLDIWKYLPRSVCYAKDVRRHKLGDLYPPTLVRMFQKVGGISSSRFVENFSHAKESYKKDLQQSKPVVFKEWRTWPEADVGFSSKDSRSVASPKSATFKKMIAVPRLSAYGWRYSLIDLRSLMHRCDL